MLVGVPLGLFSGYYGGPLDRTLVLVNDAMFAFPSLLLAILIAFLLRGKFSFLGDSFSGIMSAAISITVIYIPQYFRVIRNTVISVREEPYVEAARVLGAKPRTVIAKYVFGNVVQNVPVIATLNAADALLTLAGLGFLGYGVQPTEGAEWGYDLQRALGEASGGVWWTSVYPGLAIVLLVTGLTLVGESLNDLLNPVLRRRQLLPVNIVDDVEGRVTDEQPA
jgi:peptide/nickel transport system permease protein